MAAQRLEAGHEGRVARRNPARNPPESAQAGNMGNVPRFPAFRGAAFLLASMWKALVDDSIVARRRHIHALSRGAECY